MQQDCAVQTDTHFMESHIDKTYEWNEWVLRKRALQLADICKKATHSSQTEAKTWREDGTSQAFETRSSETQTANDKGTTTPMFNSNDLTTKTKK